MVCFPSSAPFCVILIPSIQVFDEIDDDQFDFHGYNLRKFTISIYLKYVLGVHFSGNFVLIQVPGFYHGKTNLDRIQATSKLQSRPLKFVFILLFSPRA